MLFNWSSVRGVEVSEDHQDRGDGDHQSGPDLASLVESLAESAGHGRADQEAQEVGVPPHTEPPGPESRQCPEHQPHHQGHDRARRHVARQPAPGYQEAVGVAEVVCHDDDGEIYPRYSQVTLDSCSDTGRLGLFSLPCPAWLGCVLSCCELPRYTQVTRNNTRKVFGSLS